MNKWTQYLKRHITKDNSAYSYRFPPNKRRIMFLSDVDRSAKEEEFTIPLNTIDLLLDSNKSRKFLLKRREESYYISHCLQYCILIRPTQIEESIKKLCLFSLHNGCAHTISPYIRDILIHKGINSGPAPRYSYKEMISFFPSGTIEQAIVNDDIDLFMKFAGQVDFNPNKEIRIYSYHPLDAFLDAFNDSNSYKSITYIQLIALFASVKCFRSAIAFGNFNLNEIEKYAVAGGSNEIITILEQKGIIFDNCFVTAVRFHRHDIGDWLLSKYGCENVLLESTVEFYNMRAFLFVLKNHTPQNYGFIRQAYNVSIATGNISLAKFFVDNYSEMINNNRDNSLFIAAEMNNVETVKYLVEERKANVSKQNYCHETVLNVASKKGNLSVVMYLVDECNVPLSEIPSDALFNAVRDQNFDFIKYLVEKCHVTIQGVIPVKQAKFFSYSLEKRNPVTIAAISGNLQILKYIVNAFNANVESTDEERKTALYYATKYGYLEIIKYLVEKCNASLTTICENALLIAIEKSDLILVKYLCEKCNVDVNRNIICKDDKASNIWTTKKINALQHAINLNRLDCVKYLVDSAHAPFNDENIESAKIEIKNYLKERTALHEACYRGDLQLIKFLIEKKHYYAEQKYNDESPLEISNNNNRLDIVKYLINEVPVTKYKLGVNSLVRAVWRNDISFVEFLFEKCHVNVNEEIFDELSDIHIKKYPIHLAVEKRNVDMAKCLIKTCHARVEVMRNGDKKTPLSIACQNEDTDMIKFLVEECDANLVNASALSIVGEKCNFELIKYFIEERKANVNDINIITLINATKIGNLELIKYVIEKSNLQIDSMCKVSYDGKCILGNALYVAIINNKMDIIKYLVSEKHVSVNDEIVIYTDEKKFPVFYAAIALGNLELVKYLNEEGHIDLSKRASVKIPNGRHILKTALHIASEEGHVEIIRYLINECHMDVEEKANNEVYLPKGLNSTSVYFACANNKLESVKCLIEEFHASFNDSDVSKDNKEINNYFKERSALHEACKNGDFEEVKRLIEEEKYFADQKFNECTPLTNAINYCHFEIAKYLVDNYNVNTDIIEVNMLNNVFRKGEVAFLKYLIERCHVDIEKESKNDNNDKRNSWENEIIKKTPLHYACENSNLEMVKYLTKELHMNVEERNEEKDKWGDIIENKTALLFASIQGYLPLIRYLIEECHAKIDKKDYNGWSPLHFVSRNGNLEAVKYFVEECKMNIDEEDRIGRTAIDIVNEEVPKSEPDYQEKQNRRNSVKKYLKNYLQK